MPICGWVIRLSREPELWETSLETLRSWEGVTLGALTGLSVPIVTESEDPGAVYDIPQRLMTLPGVIHVELVFSDLSDIDQVPDATLRRGMGRRGKARPSARFPTQDEVLS